MKLLQTWFSYHGRLRPFDFVVRGFAPGILLGIIAILSDDAFAAGGTIVAPFLLFSLWPASAMLWKLAAFRSPTRRVPAQTARPPEGTQH